MNPQKQNSNLESGRALRVGFIGVGSLVTKQHLPNCVRNPRFEVAYLCDLDADRLSTYGKRYGIAQTTTDYRCLLADSSIEVVIIAVNPDLQAWLTAETIKAGKNVYVEKPLSDSSDEAIKLGELARQCKVRLAIGFNRRFAPAMRDLYGMLQPQDQPLLIHYRIVDDERDRPVTFHGRSQIVDELCHIFDLFNWLIGSNPVTAYTIGSPRQGDYQILLTYQNGASASITSSSHGSFGWPKERIEVVGCNRVIAVEDFIELQAAGFPDINCKTYPGREYDGFTHGLAEACQEIGLPFYRYMRRLMEKRMLKSKLLESNNSGEKWELLARQPSQHVCIPINYTCNKGWYEAVDRFGWCIQENRPLENAGALEAIAASEVAEAAIRSLESGIPQAIEHGYMCLQD